ncbi:type II toxin-antitoxin system PemK/MazF family toxin [Paenibacillus barcinonensis]|uniref:PemK-like, MazF-like toxin of type II toxin-antitoxin system n=1 Tax=Paenibacillus barcinonensis TaxID=198119 RepID=A0A2V4WHN3_PAEBA|nr:MULTISPECIES: type II toxin-antitoxin system PemK/MazF family toxin [Paenibacillus]PYE51660.1 PemK-like, MazF-like toxin of type II toxin-antitoxin system [Paenibacillus barcinonensis]QKS56020.1 type II toxin-antitoxin system PemK/MazF family toxin [Paenibacillus barcinonensis]
MLIIPKDIYNIYREFVDIPTEGKHRPNLVVHIDDDDIYCLPITSSSPNDPPKHLNDLWKLHIDKWQSVPLSNESWVIINQLKVISKSSVTRDDYLGVLHEDDWNNVVLKSEEFEYYDSKEQRRKQKRSQNSSKRKNAIRNKT